MTNKQQRTFLTAFLSHYSVLKKVCEFLATTRCYYTVNEEDLTVSIDTSTVNPSYNLFWIGQNINKLQSSFLGVFNDIPVFKGDLVLVRGLKTIGNYETKIVEDFQGSKLERNDTAFNDDRAFCAIIQNLTNN